MKKNKKDILCLAQLIISADIILHKYNKLTIEQKIELIRKLERLKVKKK